MRLALRILRPHSLTLTLTLSLSHCLTVSLISLISLISFSSLSSLSPLSLSLLSVSRLSVSLLSLLSQEDPGKEPHIKDSSPLPPKRAPCFFLPRCPPLSHSGALAFAPPLASSVYIIHGQFDLMAEATPPLCSSHPPGCAPGSGAGQNDPRQPPQNGTRLYGAEETESDPHLLQQLPERPTEMTGPPGSRSRFMGLIGDWGYT